MNIALASTINKYIGGTLPFALYYLPGDTELVFLAGEAKAFESSLQGESSPQGFVFAPYKPSENHPLWLIASEYYAQGSDAIISLLAGIEGTSKDLSHQSILFSHDMGEASFEAVVSKAVAEIKASKTLEKVVLSRSQSLGLSSDFDAVELLLKMRKGMPSAFCYLTYIPGQGLWMGATPERLLEVEGDRAQTNALAGTLRNGTAETWSVKEIDEQQIVSDYISQRLKDVDIKDCVVEGPEEIASGSVRHLRSVFSFNIENNQQVLDVLNALHPTPAICGMPKEEADIFIAENENYSREYYAGYLGPIGIHGATHVFVNLRCMKIVGQGASLFVGAGITAGSDSEKEWQETGVKALTLLNVIRN